MTTPQTDVSETLAIGEHGPLKARLRNGDAMSNHDEQLRMEAADALDAHEATIAALVEALEAATDKQWVANATIEQCTLVDAALAKAAALK